MLRKMSLMYRRPAVKQESSQVGGSAAFQRIRLIMVEVETIIIIVTMSTGGAAVGNLMSIGTPRLIRLLTRLLRAMGAMISIIMRAAN